MSKTLASKSPRRNDTLLCQLIAWLLALAAVFIAELAWLQYFGWRVPELNAYVLFPLLGLLAFGLMWARVIAGAARQWLGLPAVVLARYASITGWAVLVLICLHPGLLVYQRFRDGIGLPPGSYESYVAPGLGWLTVLGSVCLLVFLAYELHRWYGRRPWWRYVRWAGDIALLAIFYHGLRLGSLLISWVRTVWWLYGLTLIVALIFTYWHHSRTPEKSHD